MYISSYIFKHLHYHKKAVSFVFIYHHLNLAKICSKHLGLSSCHKVMTRIASFQTLFRPKLGYFFSILYDDQSYTGKTEQLLFFLAKNFSRQNTYILRKENSAVIIAGIFIVNALIGIKIGYNNVLGNENVYFLGQTVRLCFDIQKEGTTSEFMFTFLAVLSTWVEILFERVL